MKTPIRFPIRIKILVALLLTVTIVVSVITFAMASLFQRDKSAYIHDLASVMSLHVADETRSLLEGYRERIATYALILSDENLTEDAKIGMIRDLIGDFEEFVAITRYGSDGTAASTVYDADILAAAGLAKNDILDYRDEHPLPFGLVRRDRVIVERLTISDALPCLTMAVAGRRDSSSAGDVYAAVLRSSGLDRIARSSGAFEAIVLDRDFSVLAHSRTVGSDGAGPDPWVSVLQREDPSSRIGVAKEYSLDGRMMVGGFADAGFAGVLTGVQVPKSAAFLASRELLKSLAIIALALLAASAAVSMFWSRRMTRPIERLSRAVRKVGQGRFDVEVEVDSRDEIGMLATSFNTMTSELKTRDEALEEAHAQLVQSEKMAAFGQLSAGIAHEIKNPLAGILGCAQLSIQYPDKEDLHKKNLGLIERETKRCATIIDNLMRFSRQEKAELTPTGVVSVIEDATAIVRHQLQMNKVMVTHDTEPDLPKIMGNANQLQQVLMNLMINAQQAMDETGGTIEVTVRRAGSGKLEVRVSDDGPGMPEEVRSRVFEPFFTTKASGKGTGLGLSVSYGIVKDHKGEISVESELGAGTTFIITLPAISSDDAVSLVSDEDGRLEEAA